MNLENLERKDLLDALVLEVCLVKMERLDLLVLLALLVLLVREENKVNLVHLASRVCLDLLEPPENLVNLVTRVFLERVVLPVPLDQEVSVVSLVREEALALRVSKDQEDFQELPEQMDPRVRLGQLVLLELKVLPVFKACLVREELLVSLELKVTEVTLERRDLKVLLVKMVQEV